MSVSYDRWTRYSLESNRFFRRGPLRPGLVNGGSRPLPILSRWNCSHMEKTLIHLELQPLSNSKQRLYLPLASGPVRLNLQSKLLMRDLCAANGEWLLREARLSYPDDRSRLRSLLLRTGVNGTKDSRSPSSQPYLNCHDDTTPVLVYAPSPTRPPSCSVPGRTRCGTCQFRVYGRRRKVPAATAAEGVFHIKILPLTTTYVAEQFNSLYEGPSQVTGGYPYRIIFKGDLPPITIQNYRLWTTPADHNTTG